MDINTMTDTYNRVYSAKKWTFEHLFCIFVYFVIFALPFYFSFASKNFWFDEQYARMKNNYYYTGFYAVQINYIENQIVGTQQLAIIPSSVISGLKTLSLVVNDSSDSSTFQFTLKNYENRAILSTNIIIYYDVQISALNRIVSSGFAFTIPGDLQSVSASGRLALQVQQPFNGITINKSPTINRPAYFDSHFRSPASFVDLINSHLQNPYKLQSQFYYQSTVDSTSTTLTERYLNIHILKDTQLVLPYYPSILQTFKLKFSRYFGMLMLSYLIFHNLLLLLIKNQALECNERDQVPSGVVRSSQGGIRVDTNYRNRNRHDNNQ